MAELRFLAGDRYIGCSKPACLCCLLYFKAHSAEPADPRSHLKIWPNWGPPYLAGEAKDPKFMEQRIVLTKMLVAIRNEAIEQIRRKGPPPAWQNDSTSAFTRRLAQDAPDKLQGHFERLKDRDLSDLDSSESNTDESGLLKRADSSSDVRSEASVADMDVSDTDSFSDQVSKAEENDGEESDTEGGAKL
ncbi:hypothetical protein PG994_006658 [Apiospora phragmitis]|uniref:Uncharacterized protein n=1 Tax=Apiospora phragmitis TaxID=2905665 RepID=A0ABR1VGN6_9PEZI